MNLLNTIRRTPELRSLFGERELKIIEKQVLGIQLKPSERTRLSRDIMKKFRAIKSLSEFDERSLKKGSAIKAAAERVKNTILESRYFPRVKRVVLFGSSVENVRTFRSDIDIAVEFDSISTKEVVDFRIEFSTSDGIDIQVYNVLPEKIKKNIDEKGRTLYER